MNTTEQLAVITKKSMVYEEYRAGNSYQPTGSRL